MENIVTIELHENDLEVHVFVTGYSINQDDSNLNTAMKIAKSIGQKRMQVTSYKNSGPPKKIKIDVF